jgi:HEAT repeat protein
MEFKGVFTENDTNTTRRTPLTLSYRLLEDAEKTNVLRPPAVTPVAPATPKELAAADLRRALIDLKSPDGSRKQMAIAMLTGAKPTESRHEVAAALVPALGDASWAVRQNAARALAVWTADEAYQPLVKALDDSQFSVRWAVIDALSHWKDAPTAGVLTNLMSHGQDIQQAGQALRAIGAPAEAAAAGLLGDKNQQVRYEACRILKEIGTQQSVPALTAAASDADGLMAMLAEDALKAIDARR